MDSKEAFERYADQYDNFGDEWQDMGLDKHFIAGYEAGQAIRQSLDGDPVMWSLQFDNGPINHFTTYPTLEKAEDYAALCNIGKDKSDIKIISLYTHPASADVQKGRSKKWLKTLDRWIDLMTRLKGQPIHTSMQQEVDRVRTEVMRYREHKVFPSTSNEQDQTQ